MSFAANSVIDLERSLYLTLWDGLTRKQKALLLALTNDSQQKQQKIFSQRFLTEYGLGSASFAQKALKVLIEKNLVKRENGMIVLSEVFFKM